MARARQQQSSVRTDDNDDRVQEVAEVDVGHDAALAIEPLRVELAKHDAPQGEQVGHDRRRRHRVGHHRVVGAEASSTGALGVDPLQLTRSVCKVEVILGHGGIASRDEEQVEAVGKHDSEDGHHDHKPLEIEEGLRQRANKRGQSLVQDAHRADDVEPDQARGASDGRSKQRGASLVSLDEKHHRDKDCTRGRRRHLQYIGCFRGVVAQ